MRSNKNFKISNGVLIKYIGIEKDVVVPEGVTVIGEKAFYECKNIESIVIPEGVKEIREEAFEGCCSLKKLVIPNSIRYIALRAGFPSSLDYTVKDELRYLGNETNPYLYLVWAENHIKFANIERTCKIIGGLAFYHCPYLENIIIPNSVESIGDRAFPINGNIKYNLKDGLYYLGNDDNPYLYLAGSDKEIPSTKIENSCKFIGYMAFYDCNYLTSIEIPENVISIGEGAFNCCSCIKSVQFAKNSKLKAIGYRAFRLCEQLTEVVLPEGVESIGHEAFDTNKRFNLVIPDSLLYVAEDGSLGPVENYNEKDGLCYLGNSNNPYLYLVWCRNTVANGVEIDEKCKLVSEKKLWRGRFEYLDYLDDVTLTLNKEKEQFIKSVNSNVLGKAEKLTIYALDESFDMLQKSYKLSAVKGFIKKHAQGVEISQEIREKYYAFIKEQKKEMNTLALENVDLLKLMIEQTLISVKDVDGYLEKIMNPEVRVALLEYKNRQTNGELSKKWNL